VNGRETRKTSGVLALAIGLAVLAGAAARPPATSEPREEGPARLLSPEGKSIDEHFDAWRFGAATEALAALRAHAPGSAEVQYLEGYEHYLRGDYPASIAKLKAARTQVPNHRLIEGLLALSDAARGVIEGHTERRSQHFILRFPPEDEVLADQALETLESALAVLKADLGFVPLWPIAVDVYRSPEDLAAVSPLTVAEVERTGTIALCKWARLMVTSPRALRLGYPWLDTLSHELVHYAVSSLTGDQAPVWLQEGLAKYLEGRWRNAEGADAKSRLGASSEHLLARALKSNKLITFEAMHPSMAKLPRAEDAALAFAEVATTIAFMHDQGGTAVLREALAKVATGTDARESVAAAMGVSWKDFEKNWHGYMKAQKYRTFPHFEPMTRKFRSKAAIAAKRAPSEDEAGLGLDQAGRFLRLGNMLLLRERPRAAAIEFEKGAAIAGPAHWVFPVKLGRTYLALGDVDRALATVGELRQLYPELPWPHLIAGRALLGKDDPAQAVVALEASLGLNPFDPEVHCALADAYRRLPEGTAPAARAERARRHCQARE
jgi:tetratricopeptide (TPR) repeat protein